MIEIDGSHGGQMLRTALGLSIITKKPFRMYNIRKSRSKPGLKRQHLGIIEILKKISDSKCENLYLGSEEIVFYPGKVKRYFVEYDFGCGSINLALQTFCLLSFCIEKPLKMILKGGTDVPFSPTSIYFENVFLKALEKMNIKIEYKVLKYGFYPKGGGKVEIKIYPVESPKPICLLNYSESKVFAKIICSEKLRNKKVCERIYKTLTSIDKEIAIFYKYVDSDYGVSCCIWSYNSHIVGADILGKANLKSEDLAKVLYQKFLNEKSGCDSHLGDMLVPYIFLIGGKIKPSKITSHYKSNLEVCKKFIQ